MVGRPKNTRKQGGTACLFAPGRALREGWSLPERGVLGCGIDVSRELFLRGDAGEFSETARSTGKTHIFAARTRPLNNKKYEKTPGGTHGGSEALAFSSEKQMKTAEIAEV